MMRLYYLCSKIKEADQLLGYRSLIYAFVFTFGKNRFSHDVAHIVYFSAAKNKATVCTDMQAVLFLFTYELNARKPVFGISDQVQHKLSCTIIE